MSDAPDLEILIPVRTINIANAEITLHEYSFLEGLKVDAIARPLLADLGRMFLDRDPDSDFELAELAALFGRHEEILTQLLAMSSGLPAHWVRALHDEDGQILLMTWWAVNRDFFVRRLVQQMAVRQAKQQKNGPSAGASASPG